MKEYDHKKIEKKWQKEWEKNKAFQAKSPSSRAKLATGRSEHKNFYALIEFPYPSGAGMHVGHIRSNTAMDIISRKRRMEGYNVLYPIGWDAFGLPTENYAIKTGIHPIKVTKDNTDTFRRQLKSLGFSFDWSREINTTDPKYYKWTQWIFLKLLEKGLAYKAKSYINWCLSCKIGLANEEVVDEKCERCGGDTEKREKEQWMLAITKYADRLDKDLDTVDYLPQIKLGQRNWIGRSEGAEIEFEIRIADQTLKNSPALPASGLRHGSNFSVSDPQPAKVFTTRPDTIFGATYVVLSPEHQLVQQLAEKIKNKLEVEKYIKKAKNKTEIERTTEEKVKTGVELKGVKAINPATKEEIPIWVADYVLASYGTGAIMAVPAHDERDFEFAKKYGLLIKRVVEQKFVVEVGNDAVRKNLPFVKRNAVCAVVRNPKNNKYLCVSWKNFFMHGFVTGGIEENEDIIKGALREIHEETGYKNVKLVKNPDIAIHTFFYHQVKKQNRWARFQYLFFELINEEQDPIEKKESDLHDILWKSKDELKDFFSVFEGKFVLDILDNEKYVYIGNGVLHDSGKFSDMDSEKAKKEIIKFVGGKEKTTFKLRDWVFSRQRYWGEPIPVIHCPKCALRDPSGHGWVPVPEKDLPVKLPRVKNYQPTDSGESPLANITKWVNVKCPKCKGPAKRETDTMPNWAGSSWYFLRYVDPKNNKEFASKKNLEYWTPVSWYNGGMEHTTLHLLYSRFWHKFLFDLKLVPSSEPYQKRTSHGMILGEGGVKMSKSLGNVINPDDIVKIYGADTLRLYEMFMGPFSQSVAWSTESIVGSRRFLERVWNLAPQMQKNLSALPASGLRHGPNFSASEALINKTIKKVTEDIEEMKFNTAISTLMIFVNEVSKLEVISRPAYEKFLKILSPFAPHIAEELWQRLAEKGLALREPKARPWGASICLSSWPKYDLSKIQAEEIKIVVQINGKVRAEMMIQLDEAEESVKKKALVNEAVLKQLAGRETKKVFYVKNRLINIVV